MKQAIEQALDMLAIPKGCSVMVHSDAMVVAQFPNMGNPHGINMFWSYLEHWLAGNVLVPTFTYSPMEAECFNPATTPSRVGLMTEIFRQREGVHRTLDPIFSIAISGPSAHQLATQEYHDCFGPESVFAWLAEQEGWLLGLGCHPDRLTFTHYVEQQLAVPYRYHKWFEGQVYSEGISRNWRSDYYVRDLSLASEIDLTRLVEQLKAEGAWRQALCQRVPIWAVSCRDFSRVARELIASTPYALIRAGGNQNAV
ncbi:AAC(3) family N-acetyltransferase [Aeromonas cavernicola]|uniref:Aminoglycoside N(3)-acetyltransferase n=1 Tax=Aeromonas cavernicola TaxID=1006623 RepID=A0A2H9U346_9GAMM|nr:AAC(3) family N-acetyltransferase [Aeromonas cavernicola]PJG58431.1 aminoglycoside 3-N-acetyltransferase [Aeromonas cavernicola]